MKIERCGLKRNQRRKNGCQCPFNSMQLLTYAAYISNLFIFWILVWHIFTSSKTVKIVVGIGYGILTLVILILKIVATGIDPSDPTFYKTQKLKAQGQPYISDTGDLFCLKGDTHAHANSKHGNQCNRCGLGFDHHCGWLNNGVGNRNYKLFIVLCYLLIGLNLLNLGIYTAAIIRLFKHWEKVESELSSLYNSGSVPTAIVFIFLAGIINTVILVATTNLMIFHIYLGRK